MSAVTAISPQGPASGPSAATPTAALGQLADAYWEGLLRRAPTFATFVGDERYNDRLPDVGPAGRAEEETAYRAVLAGLAEIPSDGLAAEEHITRDMLRLTAEEGLEALRLRLDEMAVDQMDGPQVWLPDLLNWHRTDTPERVAQLVARYRAFPTYVDQYLGNLADGVRDGRTAPTIAVERVVGQLRALLGTPVEASPLAAPARQFPAEQGGPLLDAVEAAVYPAFQRLLAYLEDPYLPQHARREPGVWAVADGEQIYALAARHHTTTDLTPRELHQLGQEELAGIHAEMRAIMQARGDTSGDIRRFTQRLIADPANLPASSAQILEDAEHLLAVAQAALPRAFGRLPRTPCVVKPIEPFRERDAPPAFYYPSSQDGTRPAVFYVNTFDPSSRPRHTVPALVFHEGVPGHHLQISLAQEKMDLPAFRRLGTGTTANAYVEGWALYTERLADELGLYPDDLARYGMLGYQAWRACRLLVDTGLHALRWSRQQAIDVFFQNVGLSEGETVNEVDRYIIWPGQALSYKVGHREIARLREDTRQRLGPRFDLRAFHDKLLSHGPVPLSTLRSTLAAWQPA